MKFPESAVIEVTLHDGTTDYWKIGEDFDNYNVTGNALVFMTEAGAWCGWYNLNDIQKWLVVDINK